MNEEIEKLQQALRKLQASAGYSNLPFALRLDVDLALGQVKRWAAKEARELLLS